MKLREGEKKDCEKEWGRKDARMKLGGENEKEGEMKEGGKGKRRRKERR